MLLRILICVALLWSTVVMGRLSARAEVSEAKLVELTAFLQGTTLQAESPEYTLDPYQELGHLLIHPPPRLISPEVRWDNSDQWMALSYSPVSFAPADVGAINFCSILVMMNMASGAFFAIPSQPLGVEKLETIQGVCWESESVVDFLTLSPTSCPDQQFPYIFKNFTLYRLDLDSVKVERLLSVNDWLGEMGVSLDLYLSTTSGLSVDRGIIYIAFVDGTVIAFDSKTGRKSLHCVPLKDRERMVDLLVRDGDFVYALYSNRRVDVYRQKMASAGVTDRVHLMKVEPIGGFDVVGRGKLMGTARGVLLATRRRVYWREDSCESLLWDGSGSGKVVFAVVPHARDVTILTIGEMGTGMIEAVQFTLDMP